MVRLEARCAVTSVLVLNATYEPLSVVSIRRAIVLLLKEKAELLEAAEATLRATGISMPVPLVIRMVYYVRIPKSTVLPLSRRTVMARDQYTCQYCGMTPLRAELTLDHVVPRSRGGKSEWENVVVACRGCNQKKGNRTPREAQMALMREPHRPRYVALALLGEPTHREVWSKYLF